MCNKKDRCRLSCGLFQDPQVMRDEDPMNFPRRRPTQPQTSMTTAICRTCSKVKELKYYNLLCLECMIKHCPIIVISQDKSWHQCPKCQRRFRLRFSLRRHLYVCSKNKNDNIIDLTFCSPQKDIVLDPKEKDITASEKANPVEESKEAQRSSSRFEALLLKYNTKKSSRKQIFKCRECFKTFASAKLRRKHRSLLHSSDRKCQRCQETFSNLPNFVKHWKMMHKSRYRMCHNLDQDVRIERCKKCASFFTDKTTLKLHLADVHGIQEIRCFICQKRVWQQKALQKHLSQVHGYVFRCHLCPEQFQAQDDLFRHRKSHHQDNLYKANFQCKACEAHFTRKESLHRHQRNVHNFRIKCYICHEHFLTFEEEAEHALRVHKDEGLEFSSFQMQPQTQILQQEKEEIDTMPKAKPFQCDLCTNQYQLASSLTRHKREVHGNAKRPNVDKNKIFGCPMCGFSSASKAQISAHLITHVQVL